MNLRFLKLPWIIPASCLSVWLCFYQSGQAIAQTVADAFPEIKAGWQRLEAKDQFFVGSITETRTYSNPDQERVETYEVRRYKQYLLRKNHDGDEISVLGPARVFTVVDPAGSGDVWILRGHPTSTPQQSLDELYAAFIGHGTQPDSTTPQDDAARSVITDCLIGPVSPYRFYEPRGPVTSSHCEDALVDGAEATKLTFEWEGKKDGEVAITTGFVILDPAHDYRIVRGETLSSSGKTKRQMSIDYTSDDEFELEFRLLRGVTSKEDDIEFEEDWAITYNVRRQCARPRLEEFRLAYYGINIDSRHQSRVWVWLLVGGGAFLLIGCYRYVRQHRV